MIFEIYNMIDLLGVKSAILKMGQTKQVTKYSVCMVKKKQNSMSNNFRQIWFLRKFMNGKLKILGK